MTTGPFAVRSESLTGFPSVPLSAKSGAFCPTSSALAALTSSAPANSARSAVRMVRDGFIRGISFRGVWGAANSTRRRINSEPPPTVPRRIAVTLPSPWERKHGSDEARPIALDDEPPQDAALAPVVVAMGTAHRRAVVDDQHVTLAPGMVIDDFRPD